MIKKITSNGVEYKGIKIYGKDLNKLILDTDSYKSDLDFYLDDIIMGNKIYRFYSQDKLDIEFLSSLKYIQTVKNEKAMKPLKEDRLQCVHIRIDVDETGRVTDLNSSGSISGVVYSLLDCVLLCKSKNSNFPIRVKDDILSIYILNYFDEIVKILRFEIIDRKLFDKVLAKALVLKNDELRKSYQFKDFCDSYNFIFS